MVERQHARQPVPAAVQATAFHDICASGTIYRSAQAVPSAIHDAVDGQRAAGAESWLAIPDRLHWSEDKLRRIRLSFKSGSLYPRDLWKNGVLDHWQSNFAFLPDSRES